MWTIRLRPPHDKAGDAGRAHLAQGRRELGRRERPIRIDKPDRRGVGVAGIRRTVHQVEPDLLRHVRRAMIVLDQIGDDRTLRGDDARLSESGSGKLCRVSATMVSAAIR